MKTKTAKTKTGRKAIIPWSEFNLQMANAKIPDVKIVNSILAKYRSNLKGGASEDPRVVKNQRNSVSVMVNTRRKNNPKFNSALQKSRKITKE